MKICITLLSLLAALNAFAQNKQTLEIAKKDTLITNSFYRKITLIDARQDTSSFGFVQTGAFNRRANVVTASPLQTLLSDYLTAITDPTAQNGELLLRLKQFELSEITGAMSEKGFCRLEAVLYARNGDSYQKLASVDTVYTIKGGMDVTQKLLKTAGSYATAFIVNNLQKKPADSQSLTLTEIVNLEELLKRSLKVYTTDKFVDGVYTSYQSFKNQVPDKQIKVDGYIAYPGVVRQIEADGKAVKVKGQNTYAIVFMGRAYVTTKSDYYELKKLNNELLFTGQVREVGGTTQMLAAGMFGMLGALMAANSEVTYEMKIDPVNGRFICLRQVADKATASY